MNKIFKKTPLFFVSILLILFSACKKDRFIKENKPLLSFSKDTVIFDTVFSTIGSVTEVLKVYNPNNFPVTISRVAIAGGSQSDYIINVDGETGPTVEDITIRKNDSLFIFVEVTVDPQNSNSPMIVSDSILFTTNNIKQSVKLVAWGQDAHYHTANTFALFLDENNDSIKIFYHSVTCNETWTNDKPHVIYGYAIIEPGCVLNIQEGSKLHFYNNSGLIVGTPFLVFPESSLKVNGTLDNPVVFTGTRLDEAYREDPGQWDRIWFTLNSVNSEINYAIIKNGNIGIHADTNLNGTPTVTIKNSVIKNHAGLGILGQGSYIYAENTVVANCGQYLAALIYGGKYEFNHCTFANFWEFGSRTDPSIILNNYIEDANENQYPRDMEMASFTNCIIYGGLENELFLDGVNEALFEYTFDHCILKTDTNTSDASRFINIIKNPANISLNGVTQDPIFTDASDGDFSIFETSVARNNGVQTSVTLDIENNMRDADPDIGAYEYE